MTKTSDAIKKIIKQLDPMEAHLVQSELDCLKDKNEKLQREVEWVRHAFGQRRGKNILVIFDETKARIDELEAELQSAKTEAVGAYDDGYTTAKRELEAVHEQHCNTIRQLKLDREAWMRKSQYDRTELKKKDDQPCWFCRKKPSEYPHWVHDALQSKEKVNLDKKPTDGICKDCVVDECDYDCDDKIKERKGLISPDYYKQSEHNTQEKSSRSKEKPSGQEKAETSTDQRIEGHREVKSPPETQRDDYRMLAVSLYEHLKAKEEACITCQKLIDEIYEQFDKEDTNPSDGPCPVCDLYHDEGDCPKAPETQRDDKCPTCGGEGEVLVDVDPTGAGQYGPCPDCTGKKPKPDMCPRCSNKCDFWRHDSRTTYQCRTCTRKKIFSTQEHDNFQNNGKKPKADKKPKGE